MSLHVVVGTANSGKTGLIHGAVRDAVGQRRSAALLLPALPDVHRAQRELSGSCSVGLEVQRLDRFIDDLWAGLGDPRRIVARSQRMLLLQKARLETSLDLLGESADQPGFTYALETLVMRAAESGVLRETYDRAGGVAGELLEIIGRYKYLLGREGLVERAEAHHLVSDNIDGARLPDVIAANRFGNLTIPQERFCIAASRASEMWIGLTWAPGFPATVSVDALVGRLAAEGELHIAEEPSAGDTPGELKAIERALFAPNEEGKDAPEPAGAVILSDAWGGEAEAARITREVQDALSDGIAPGDVAVVFRSPEGHAGRLKAAFRDAGIQAEYDLYVPLATVGIVAAVAQLLRFMRGQGERRDLIGFLRTPYSSAVLSELDELDARLRRYRVKSRDELVHEASRLGEGVASILGLSRRLSDTRITESSVEDWGRLVSAMLKHAYGCVSEMGETGRLDARATSSIIQVVREMADAHTLEFTADDLLMHIRDARLSLPSEERGDHVQVLGAERMRGRRFSHVILGGLTADEFPRMSGDDALTAAGVRATLQRVGVDMTPRVDLDAERLLFYQVVTRARHKLVLSRRVSNDDGAPARPSPLLEELLDLYRDPSAEEGGWYSGPLPRRTVTLADLTTGPDVPATTRRALRATLSSGASASGPEGEPRVDHARWRARPKPPCLADDIAEELSSRSTFTASQIEAYLGCPYRWYVQNVLRPEALDVEFDSAARGTVAHDIMRRFYELLPERTQRRRVTPASLREALGVHDLVVDETLGRLDLVGISEQLDMRRVVRATRRLIEEDATLLDGFTPAHHEWSFGVDDEPEPFDGFSLKGRVDRIDISPEGFVVTDYKSGQLVDMQAAKFESKGLVQLPLYAWVVQRRLDVSEPIGAFYRSVLHAQKPRGFFLSGALDLARFTRTDAMGRQEIEGLIDDAITRASKAVAGMKAGKIPRDPANKDCPSYCPARVYCEGVK